MARLFVTLVLVVLILAGATWEHLYICDAYDTLERQLDVLSAIVYSEETDINTDENIKKAEDMYKYWLKKEKHLTMLARHTDLAFVSDSLIYIKNFIAFNVKEEACVGIEKLRYLIDTHKYNVGTSIQNVI
jgi:hypothetical protein